MTQLNFLTVSADTWLLVLVETSLRLSVILLVAGVIAMVLRRSAANLRHLPGPYSATGLKSLQSVVSRRRVVLNSTRTWK